MADIAVKGVLTDEHLVRLSQRLTNYGNLRSLGYRGLKLQHEEIEQSITNKPSDVQSAAYDILQTWVKQQETREKAFSDVYVALKESQLQMSNVSRGTLAMGRKQKERDKLWSSFE